MIFISNGGVFDSYGKMLYDILPGFDRSTKVGWINSDATRYIFTSQDTASFGENIIEVYGMETGTSTTTTTSSTTTSIQGECELVGDDSPCGEVTLSEVIGLITLWSQGQASLPDVISLINAWANG